MRFALLATTVLVAAGAAHAQSLQTGTIGGMPYYLLPASGGCSAATPCDVITYLGVQSESAGAIANDVQNYFGGSVGPHTIVIAPQESGSQDATNNWGGYNSATTPEQAQMVAVVQGVEAQMGNTVNPAASVVTGGSLGGTGTQAALIAYGPKGQVQPGVFSAGVSFDAADWSAASDPSQVAALCGVPLTAVHGTADTNQSISFDQNLASAINGNPACGNSFTLTPVQGAGHGTWGGPSGYPAGTSAGTPLATIAADLGSAPATTTMAPPSTKAPTSSTPGDATSTNALATPAVANSPATTPSAQMTPGKGSVTDCNGVVWTVSADGHVMQGTTQVAGGGDTSALQMVGCTVYGQDNGDDPGRANAGGWFTLGGGGWTASAAPSNATTTATTASPSPSTQAATAATTPAIAAPVVCGNGVASGAFKIVNGQIIGPDGKPFIARGINLYDSQLGDAGAMVAMFPGINYFRISVGHDGYHDPSYYQTFITQMTSAGRVVELEDHPDGGGGQDSSPPGGLATESAWYASIGGAFANNPYVWFGTFNEPAVGDPGSLSAWHKATYDAIRGAGNNNPILIEPGGSRPPNLVAALVPSTYASMKNIIMDPHIYGYQTDYSTDQATNDANVAAMIQAAQTIKSADGTIGVLIAEYGNSTEGVSPDPNGVQSVTAVITAGANGQAGSAAWAWLPGGSSDHLQDGGTLTSPYGQQVALYINTSVVPCSTAESAANANATLASVTAQVTGTPQADTATPTDPAATSAIDQSTDAMSQAADASIAQANAIIAAAQAQMQAAPAAAQ